MKKLLGIFSIIVLLLFPFLVYAEGYEVPNFNYYEYEINNYDVLVNVTKDNKFEITEKIEVFFNVDKQGIFRKIPRKNKVVRLDGTTSFNTAKIKNIKIDNNIKSITRDNDYLTIKIGDSNRLVRGKQTYKISYTYNIGNDPNKDFDEFYFNIIGPEWEDTIIHNTTFTINMPKDFDTSLLGFSSGSYGSKNSQRISYNVENTKIEGKMLNALQAREALTVRLELPEGYFELQKTPDITTYVIASILALIFLITTITLWFKYGKNEKPIETVEFYPPNMKNSAEIGMMYKGYAIKKDIVSLLIYLASKGYITIVQSNKKLFGSKYSIIKRKEYDGTDKNEQIFMSSLFIKGDVVTGKDLEQKFYITVNQIISNLNKSTLNKSMFDELSKKARIKIFIFIMIIAFLTGLNLVIFDIYFLLFAIIIFVVSLLISFIGKLLLKNGNEAGNLIKNIMPIGFLLVMLSLVNVLTLEIGILRAYLSAFNIIAMTLMMIIMFNTKKRSEFGLEILGKTKGFKNFLKSAEKDRLEELVERDPQYFYNILPYTYVLNVSNKWIKKFESIAIEPPNWYDSPSGFNFMTFNSFVNSTYTSASRSMTSSPSSSGGGGSSGGGSSGGGFSGGGSGGGGGGSW